MNHLDKEKETIVKIRKCQRNWDLSKKIPQEHIDHWIYLCENAPTKQDESRYALCVVTDKKIKDIIYDDYCWGSHRHGVNAGRNTQVGANALFVFGETESFTDNENDVVGVDNDRDSDNVSDGFDYRSDINFNRDIGIAMGIVAFSAGMMGYYTGFNTNVIYNKHNYKDWMNLLGYKEYFRPRVILGIGHPDPTLKWFESRDLEYIDPDPRESDLDKKTMLEDYKGIRKTWTDVPLRTFGPLSADPETGKPNKKGLSVKVLA